MKQILHEYDLLNWPLEIHIFMHQIFEADKFIWYPMVGETIPTISWIHLYAFDSKCKATATCCKMAARDRTQSRSHERKVWVHNGW